MVKATTNTKAADGKGITDEAVGLKDELMAAKAMVGGLQVQLDEVSASEASLREQVKLLEKAKRLSDRAASKKKA